MALKRKMIVAVKSRGSFDTTGLTDHTSEMNRRISRKIRNTEKKIAQGIDRTQGYQTKQKYGSETMRMEQSKKVYYMVVPSVLTFGYEQSIFFDYYSCI